MTTKAKKDPKLEYPDPTPLVQNFNLPQRETTEEKIRRIIAEQFTQRFNDNDIETFEESQDFEVDEEFERGESLSGYEVQEMDSEVPNTFHEQVEIHNPDVAPVSQENEGEETGDSSPSKKEIVPPEAPEEVNDQ